MFLAVAFVAAGFWYQRHTADVARERSVEADQVVRSIEKEYTPDRRPAPVVVEVSFVNPSNDGVDFPKVSGTRIYKYSGSRTLVTVVIQGDGRARGHCFEVTYGVSDPVQVRQYLCPGAP